jgi:WhiB family transcriptional regulator, redox-sensing transcriptional regulator
VALTRGDLRSIDLLFGSDDERYATLGDLLAAIATRPAWTAHAACRGMDTELFFPTRGEPATEAKAVCRTCTVRDDCHDYALADAGIIGIWSATTTRERIDLRSTKRNNDHEAA